MSETPVSSNRLLIILTTGFFLATIVSFGVQLAAKNTKPRSTKNIITAAMSADSDFVKSYLDNHPGDINKPISKSGATILYLVVGKAGLAQKEDQKEELELIKYLLDNGANINLAVKPSGYTPLHKAAWSGGKNVPAFKLLLKRGANPQARAILYPTLVSHSVLETAAMNGHAEYVELLIQAKAPVAEKIEHNSQHPSKYSLYYHSAILEACRYKLSPCYRDDNGKTLPQYLGNKKVLALLLKEIKDINEIQGLGGVNALHIALDNGFPERAKFLLEKCPNLDASDGELKGTPLDIVAKSKKLTKAQKEEMTKLLKAHIKKYQQAKNKSKLKTP